MARKSQISTPVVVGGVLAVAIVAAAAILSGVVDGAVNAYRAWNETQQQQQQQEGRTERTGLLAGLGQAFVSAFTSGARAAVGAV